MKTNLTRVRTKTPLKCVKKHTEQLWRLKMWAVNQSAVSFGPPCIGYSGYLLTVTQLSDDLSEDGSAGRARVPAWRHDDVDREGTARGLLEAFSWRHEIHDLLVATAWVRRVAEWEDLTQQHAERPDNQTQPPVSGFKWHLDKKTFNEDESVQRLATQGPKP